MPLHIIRGDITKVRCDAVLHAETPELPASAYREALLRAKEQGTERIAIPLYGTPQDSALHTAVEEIRAFLQQNEMTIFLVVPEKTAFGTGARRFSDVAAYIDQNYAGARTEPRRAMRLHGRRTDVPLAAAEMVCGTFQAKCGAPAETESAAECNAISLDEELQMLDESFSQMLLRKIDEKGMTDAECYKKANIDRKLFSKIRSAVHYKPSKTTAIAFAVALELPLPEARELLMKAGFALSRSSKFDVIVEYFIRNGNYNIFEINEALFAFDQSLLGA